MVSSKSTPMRTPYTPAARRRILCVYPVYARSFGTFQHAYPFFGGLVRAFMPPQGLLAVAAYLPETWEVRFVDENSQPATDDDFRWADAVFVSGMHVQRPRIHDVIARAHAHGRPVVLGGPSVSGCPEYYLDADVLHLGELGDATDRLIEYLDHAGVRADPPARVLHRQHPVLERLPVLVRVLRHPGALRAQSTIEDARADLSRAGSHRRRRVHVRLLRRRQFHRQSEGHAGAAAAPRGVAGTPPVPAALRLRGDAQHRQERAHAGPDARGGFHHGVLRHRDAGAAGAALHVQEIGRAH